jgi:hypothetical protein
MPEPMVFSMPGIFERYSFSVSKAPSSGMRLSVSDQTKVRKIHCPVTLLTEKGETRGKATIPDSVIRTLCLQQFALIPNSRPLSPSFWSLLSFAYLSPNLPQKCSLLFILLTVFVDKCSPAPHDGSCTCPFPLQFPNPNSPHPQNFRPIPAYSGVRVFPPSPRGSPTPS